LLLSQSRRHKGTDINLQILNAYNHCLVLNDFYVSGFHGGMKTFWDVALRSFVMEAVSNSEMSVNFAQTTWRNILTSHSS
jgi:hypothetical protein